MIENYQYNILNDNVSFNNLKSFLEEFNYNIIQIKQKILKLNFLGREMKIENIKVQKKKLISK